MIDKIAASIKEYCKNQEYDSYPIDFDDVINVYKNIREEKSLQTLNEKDNPLTTYIALIEIANEIGIDKKILDELHQINTKLKNLLFSSIEDSSVLSKLEEIDGETLKTQKAKNHGYRSSMRRNLYDDYRVEKKLLKQILKENCSTKACVLLNKKYFPEIDK